MIVTIHQPAYLPWLGYLAKIAAADSFVLLDTVQFEKGWYINRNRIKTQTGELMLTIPVRRDGLLSVPLADVQIDDSRPWRRKHLRAIELAYHAAPRFEHVYGHLRELYDHTLLTELCLDQLRFWLDEFGIDTPIIRARDLGVEGLHSSELLLAICRAVGADTYLSGPHGRDYLDERVFARAGIALEYHHFVHPVYAQMHGGFVSGLAALDAAMVGYVTMPSIARAA